MPAPTTCQPIPAITEVMRFLLPALFWLRCEFVASRRQPDPMLAIRTGCAFHIAVVFLNRLNGPALSGVVAEPSRGIRRNRHVPRRRVAMNAPIRLDHA